MTASVSLGGCVSPEEQRQQDVSACNDYGFQPNTADFASCLQRESLARRYPPEFPFWYTDYRLYWWR